MITINDVKARATLPGGAARGTELVLRLLVVVALVVDVVLHLDLAPDYAQAYPGTIDGGMLFVAESVVAALVAVYLLLRGSRLAYAVAALVLLTAVAALLLPTYTEVPAIGPFPSMYEPIWFPEKTLTAIAEATGGLLALIGIGVAGRTRRTSGSAGVPHAGRTA